MPQNPGSSRIGVTHLRPRGSPRRSFRWHYKIFDELAQMEADRGHRVTVNNIASVAVEWGLAFLRTLEPGLQGRILGVKGTKPLTFQEQYQVREELGKRLGSKAGAFRLDARLGLALAKPVKESLRSQAEATNTSMSSIVRRRLFTE